MSTESQPNIQPESSPSATDVKATVKKFRWTTFALILFFFVLPFAQVSCQQQKLISLTGFQLAFGTEIQEPQMFGPTRTRKVSGEATVLLGFLAALAGLGCSFVKSKSGSLAAAICAAIGFLLMLAFKARLDNEILKQSGGVLNVDYLIGFVGATFTFLTSAVLNGYFFYLGRYDPVPVTDAATNPTIDGTATNTSETFDQFKSSAADVAAGTRDWFVKKDLLGWLRRHAVVVGAIGGVALLLLIVYYAFLKASPAADGKRAAVAYVDCQTAYTAKVDSAYQSFLSGFSGQVNQTRSSARARLESLLTGGRQVYNTCTGAADKLYSELSARYTDDRDELVDFSNAFTGNNGGTKSADDIEAASSLIAEVHAKIESIRAPLPDANRIAHDLIGKSMDGWNFSYASEFKDVKVVNETPDGDLSILRTHLKLEGAITKEPYFAVLDVKYRLNSNGEWDYDGLTELLHDKADVSYFIGEEIFLVGKWRWQENYATYNRNGTWFGNHDNGTQMTGTWRIVGGNLVLTLNGQNWVNRKIVQFSKNELIIDETALIRAERVQ